MGGPAVIVVDAPALHSAASEAAVVASVELLTEIEHRYSRYRQDSLVSLINRRAGTRVVTPIDDETRALLGLAQKLYNQSDGRFDVTSGVLRHAWDFREGRVVDPTRIDALLKLIGSNRIQLTPEGVLLPEPGMEIDLGALVKEYAADSVVALLRRRGIRHALVSLAGDIVTLGVDGSGTPWRLGVCDPACPERELFVIELADAAVATSGNYRRNVSYGDRQIGHLLDARTGWPVTGPASVTVLADDCITAGAIATAACLMPVADAEEWLRRAGLPWHLVDERGLARGSILATSI